MKFSEVFPVIALIAGWALNELSRYLGFRQERRGAIAQALADLMEIRYQMVALRTVARQVQQRLEVPPALFPIIKELLTKLFPIPTELHTRYDKAVTLIASSDPVLGYRLRSKNLAADYIARLSDLANYDKDTIGAVHETISTLEELVIPELDKTILALAKRHSLLTYLGVKHRLNQKPEWSAEQETLLQQIKQGFKVQHQPGTSEAP